MVMKYILYLCWFSYLSFSCLWINSSWITIQSSLYYLFSIFIVHLPFHLPLNKTYSKFYTVYSTAVFVFNGEWQITVNKWYTSISVDCFKYIKFHFSIYTSYWIYKGYVKEYFCVYIMHGVSLIWKLYFLFIDTDALRHFPSCCVLLGGEGVASYQHLT